MTRLGFLRAGWFGGLGLLLLTSQADAQQPPPITIQLPTYSFFTVQTSVLVPDGGGAYLGGISRGQIGSRYRGTPFLGKAPGVGPLLGNRGYGSSFQNGGMQVRATIIDNHEIDQQVLAEGLAMRGYDPETSLAQLAKAQQQTASAPPANEHLQGVASVQAIQQSQRVADEQQQQEAQEMYAKAVAYEEKNQLGLAKIFYRMAGTRAVGDLRNQALTRLAVLERSRTSTAVAGKEY